MSSSGFDRCLFCETPIGHWTLLWCCSFLYTYDVVACHFKFQIAAICMANLNTKTNCTLSDFVPLPLLCLPTPTHSFFFLCFSENDETGVMDSLLEALQSGAAFRDRRKRAPRPRGMSHILYLFLYTNKSTQKTQYTHRLIQVRCSEITVNPNRTNWMHIFLFFVV